MICTREMRIGTVVGMLSAPLRLNCYTSDEELFIETGPLLASCVALMCHPDEACVSEFSPEDEASQVYHAFKGAVSRTLQIIGSSESREQPKFRILKRIYELAFSEVDDVFNNSKSAQVKTTWEKKIEKMSFLEDCQYHVFRGAAGLQLWAECVVFSDELKTKEVNEILSACLNILEELDGALREGTLADADLDIIKNAYALAGAIRNLARRELPGARKAYVEEDFPLWNAAIVLLEEVIVSIEAWFVRATTTE